MQTCLNAQIHPMGSKLRLAHRNLGEGLAQSTNKRAVFLQSLEAHISVEMGISYLQIKGAAFFWDFVGPPTGLDDMLMKRSVDMYSNTSHQTPKNVKRTGCFLKGFLDKSSMNLNFFPAALNKKKNSPLHSSVHQQDAHIKYHEKLQKRPPPLRFVDLYNLRGGRGPGGTAFHGSWILFLEENP